MASGWRARVVARAETSTGARRGRREAGPVPSGAGLTARPELDRTAPAARACLDLGRGGHRGGALQAGGDDGAGRVGVPHDRLQVPAGQQAVAEGAAERVAGAEAVEDLDRERRDLGASSPSRWTARTPFGPCLTTASSTPASSRARAAACGSRSPVATSHLVEVADGDGGVAQGLGVEAGGGPVVRGRARTSAASRGRRPSSRPWRGGRSAARVAVRLGSSLRPVPVDPEDPGVADRVEVELVRRGSPGRGPWAAGRSTAGSRPAGRSRRR